MNYLKRHKEIIPFIIVLAVFVIASINLFQNQQVRSHLISNGTIVLPTSAQCEVPFQDSFKRMKKRNEMVRKLSNSDSLEMNINLLELQTN